LAGVVSISLDPGEPLRANAGPTNRGCQLVFIEVFRCVAKTLLCQSLLAGVPKTMSPGVLWGKGQKCRLHREGRRFEPVTAHQPASRSALRRICILARREAGRPSKPRRRRASAVRCTVSPAALQSVGNEPRRLSFATTRPTPILSPRGGEAAVGLRATHATAGLRFSAVWRTSKPSNCGWPR
jgi:hypothetical protein